MKGWPDAVAASASDIQALVTAGFKQLPQSRATLVDFGDAKPAALRVWLARLHEHVTSAAAIARTDAALAAPTIEFVLQLAFSHDGIKRLRPDLVDPAVQVGAAGFGTTFSQGMTDPLRWAALRDAEAVIPDGLAWRGTVPSGKDPALGAACGHMLMLQYATDAATLDRHASALLPMPPGARVVRTIETWLTERPSKHPRASASEPHLLREHFGFNDALSQPQPAVLTTPAKAGIHDVAIGDLLFGFPNAYGDVPTGPVVGPAARGYGELADTGSALRSFAANGTFLVVRELRQDVAGFWNEMAEEAARLSRLAVPGTPPIDDLWLAQRAVGRGLHGTMCRNGSFPAPQPGIAGNNFGFIRNDADGRQCPLGSHVRRANPRDAGLPPHFNEADRLELLRSTNNHRILRRGRPIGPPAADPTIADGVERGLLFIAINTDIARQFELIMRSWLLNPAFAALDGEIDPLTGSKSSFSVPAAPARRRATLQRWVELVGGDYYFLPGLGALKMLCQ